MNKRKTNPSMDNDKRKKMKTCSDVENARMFFKEKTDLCNQDFDVEARLGLNTRIIYFGGIIYKIETDSSAFAMKIFVMHSQDDIRVNNNEIKIAKLLSSLVENGTTPYFPLVVTSGYCENFKYPDHGDRKAKYFKESAFMFGLRKVKKTIIAEKLNRKMESITQDEYFKYREVFKEEMDKIDKYKIGSPGQYMVSELGKADYMTWVDEYTGKDKVDKLKGFLEDVLMGVHQLQVNGILHGDVHKENILIMNRKHGDIAVIHDFGKSRIVDPLLHSEAFHQQAQDFMTAFSYGLEKLDKNEDIHSVFKCILRGLGDKKISIPKILKIKK